MSPYARPRIADPIVLDADGAPIPYGERWTDGPPHEACSVDLHPERFAPLHEVADAVVTYLVRAFDVTVVHDVRAAADLDGPSDPASRFDVLQAVRLTPSDPSSAPMTLVWDAYPGVSLGAGAAFEAHVPACGCEACDETWQHGADELERIALAVAEGRMQEQVTRWPRSGHGHRIRSAEGESSGWSTAPRGSDEWSRAERRRLRDARRRLSALRDGAWAPWPRRPLA